MSGKLRGLHVGSLLVSASYGIGFLFGTGELALEWGMAGSLYAIATALGMLVLAVLAPAIWRRGVPLWDQFGHSWGPDTRRLVAALSLVWMTGVLAAQFHGAVAVANLLGLPTGLALVGVGALVVLIALLEIGVLARLFAPILLTCTSVLVYALVSANGVSLYLEAGPLFVRDLALVPVNRLSVTLLAVVPLVVLGVDYQQFILEARSASAARSGALVAALVLLACGTLPAAVVMASRDALAHYHSGARHDVLPWLLVQAVGGQGKLLSTLLLASLLAAALGSAAAILRAMASAVSATWPRLPERHPALKVSLAALGAVIALRGQDIVSTMVSLNLVYLACVAVPFVLTMRKAGLASSTARAAMHVGLVVSIGIYLLEIWLGPSDTMDLTSLVTGLTASALVIVVREARNSRCHSRLKL